MEKLCGFFNQLKGGHITKKEETSHQKQPAPLVVGIDCCDVEDTCCDQYD
jgi:hypothetical protein